MPLLEKATPLILVSTWVGGVVAHALAIWGALLMAWMHEPTTMGLLIVLGALALAAAVSARADMIRRDGPAASPPARTEIRRTTRGDAADG